MLTARASASASASETNQNNPNNANASTSNQNNQVQTGQTITANNQIAFKPMYVTKPSYVGNINKPNFVNGGSASGISASASKPKPIALSNQITGNQEQSNQCRLQSNKD